MGFTFFNMSMLSRIADNLFWLNRYMERTDGLVRTLRNFYILSFENDVNNNRGYQPLLNCYTSLEGAELEAKSSNTGAMLNFLVTDLSNNNSIRVLVGKARENARGSQDKITKELWEQVNSLYHYINQPDLVDILNGQDALSVIDNLHLQTLLYNGVVDSTMPRGMGWDFMNTGKYLERCLQTIDMTEYHLMQIDYRQDDTGDVSYWRHLLLSLSGYELYLKNNRGIMHTRQVIDQVIFSRYFTHSVFYGLDRISKYLREMTTGNPLAASVSLQKQLGRLRSMVEYTDGPALTDDELKSLINEMRQQIWDFSTNFSKLFFSYT
jgi:uncharacterized alpha-E superfamily protein